MILATEDAKFGQGRKGFTFGRPFIGALETEVWRFEEEVVMVRIKQTLIEGSATKVHEGTIGPSWQRVRTSVDIHSWVS